MAMNKEAGDIARRNVASSITFSNGDSTASSINGSPMRAMSPEARNVAEKNKARGGEWYRHDNSSPSAAAERPVTRGGSAEAENIASRNRGAVAWYKHDDNIGYKDPVATPRCTSDEAKESYEKSKGTLGAMFSEMKTNGTPTKESPRKSSNGNKGNTEEIAGSRPTPLAEKYKRRVKPEAEANFSRNQGTTGNLISCVDSPRPDDERPHSRLTHEAEANFIRNKGSMTGIFGTNNGGSPSNGATPSKRGVTAENKKYVDRSRGTVSDLFNSYGKLERPKKPMDRVRPEARKTADKMKQDHVSEIMSPR